MREINQEEAVQRAQLFIESDDIRRLRPKISQKTVVRVEDRNDEVVLYFSDNTSWSIMGYVSAYIKWGFK